MKCVSRRKSSAVKDTDDISILLIYLGNIYRYRIDIGKGDIDPPLLSSIDCAVPFN